MAARTPSSATGAGAGRAAGTGAQHHRLASRALARGRAAKESDAEILQGKLDNRISLPGIRDPAPGRSYAPPRHVVTIEAVETAPERGLETVEDVVADPVGNPCSPGHGPGGLPGRSGAACGGSQGAPVPLRRGILAER